MSAPLVADIGDLSSYVLLNSLNELGKRDKMRDSLYIFSQRVK